MKTSYPPYLFLLGGHDLEMLEIKRLLDQQGADYVDRNLGWGAQLSAYQDILGDDDHEDRNIVGIELGEDLAPPKNYTRIDHHNDFDGKPAAILQIVDLLGLHPTRWQALVGANDSGFIPAMQAMGATTEEIIAVRAADRKAQGLTKKDWRMAEESIARNSKMESEVIIVKALPGMLNFTPFTDQLYGKTDRLLCYTDSKLTYYWQGVGQLAQVFAKEIAQGIAYQGGGEDGYFGLAEGKAPGKIEDWIARILEVLEDV
jgi:hypothetical protein